MALLIRLAKVDDLQTIANFNVRMALETENKSLDEVTVLKGEEYDNNEYLYVC